MLVGSSGKVRNGRVVIDGAVKDVLLDPNPWLYEFSASRYTPAFEDLVAVSAGDLNNGFSGFEARIDSETVMNRYSLLDCAFDVLEDAEIVYAHPSLDDVVGQLGVSSIAPFLGAGNFGLKATGEKIGMEVGGMAESSGRTATFRQQVAINGEPYFLEVKGANFDERPIVPELPYLDYSNGKGCLTLAELRNSLEMYLHLNRHGLKNSLLIAAFTLPLRQFDGQQLGAYIRAVKAYPTIAHYSGSLPEVAASLGMENGELADFIIRGAARDMAVIWNAGIVHMGHLHEQNIRIGSVTDFTNSSYVRDAGFSALAMDAATLVLSAQNIIGKLSGARDSWVAAREIIREELNSHLGLGLPRNAGTATIAARVYDLQCAKGLTNPNEKVEITQAQNGSNVRLGLSGLLPQA